MTDRFFTDEELVAYLDGESDFAPADEIRAALPLDAALQKRVEALSFDSEVIAQGFQHLAPEANALPHLPSPRKSSFGMNNVAAAAVVALLCGSVAGFAFSNKEANPNNWIDYVAAYQALYINATLSGVNTSAATQRAELQRVTSAIGKDISLDALQFTNQVDYKRAQILGFKGKPLIQLAFLSRTGEPIALCIFRNGDTDAEITEQLLEGMQSASWSRDGYGYVLIGSQDEQLINQMASHFVTLQL